MPDARRTRRRPRLKEMAVTGLLVLLLGGCSWTAGDQYFIHWSPSRADVIVRQRASWDLTLARELFHANNNSFKAKMGNFSCRGNRNWTTSDRCVLRLLHDRAGVPAIGKGVWERATSDVDADRPRFRDFQGAFGQVIAAEDDRAQVSVCLTLSHSTVTQQNWTTRSRSDSNCRLGKHAWS